jgi:hypothetical protein
VPDAAGEVAPVRRLTNDPGDNFADGYSRDGRFIALSSTRAQRSVPRTSSECEPTARGRRISPGPRLSWNSIRAGSPSRRPVHRLARLNTQPIPQASNRSGYCFRLAGAARRSSSGVSQCANLDSRRCERSRLETCCLVEACGSARVAFRGRLLRARGRGTDEGARLNARGRAPGRMRCGPGPTATAGSCQTRGGRGRGGETSRIRPGLWLRT